MKPTLPTLSLIALSLLASYAPSSYAASADSAALSAANHEQTFAAFSERFLEAYWQQYPEAAIAVGYYQHAARLVVPDDAARAAELAFAQHWLAEANKFDASRLSDAERTDLALIKNQLEPTAWFQQQFRAFEWDPSEYNVANGFALLLNTAYAPLDERLRSVLTRLPQVPAYYAAAQAAIKQPTREHTELAISQNRGAVSLLGAALEKQVADSGLSRAEKTLFVTRLSAARRAINAYVSWLEAKKKTLDGGKARSFRIGQTAYDKKFAYQIQSGYSAEQLYQRALAEKETLHARMDTLADELWPRYLPTIKKPSDRLEKIGALIEKLSENHVKRDEFVPEIKRQIPQLEQWVREHKLLTLDPSRPLVVRETPEYMRGVAGASISAPGPYDPKANTYYNVTPLTEYTPEQAESYLREYNHWILQILNIHEAVPGHYVQLLYANKSPSKIKSLFGNGAMVEGWAVYSERMMLESGYGGNTPEMWLMYSKWNLRVVCNAIVDYRVHTQNASEADTLKLLTREAFQSETEARGKWRRATLSSVQLTSYFAGYAEIYDFRESLKKAQGERFDLRAFHEEFLSFGSAPVGMVKRLMTR